MNDPDPLPGTPAARIVELSAHPLFLLGALGLWALMGYGDAAAIVALALALLGMELLERWVPAKPQWRLRATEKLVLVGVYLLFLLSFGVVLASYEMVLAPTLAGLRQWLGVALWPSDLPLLVQVLLLYFASDFIFYWIHRGVHRFAAVWRLSGHGFHHAFQRLHALNSGSSHPFEALLLALPAVIVGALLGPRVRRWRARGCCC